MDEFFHREARDMSSDEPRVEPTLILKDAPSIANDEPRSEPKPELKAEPKPELQPEPNSEATSEAKAEPAEIAIITPKLESAAPEAPHIETPKAETGQIEAPKPELPRIEAPSLPPAPQLAEPPVPFKTPRSSIESAPAQPRSTRFALLAASVAIAASFGAIAGSLGVAKLGPALTAPPVAVAPVAKEQVADEVKALKETVAQLRATTRSLSDNFAALKTTVASTGAQNSKIAETLERLERGQSELRKVSTTQAAAPETTGSVAQKQAAPMVLGDPPTTLKPPIVQGWVLRRVYDGAALLEGRDGIIEVEPGITAPGLGRIEGIKRQDGRWVVVTSRGLVVGR
jgi:hypothetical protein